MYTIKRDYSHFWNLHAEVIQNGDPILTCKGSTDNFSSDLKKIDDICSFFHHIVDNFMTRIEDAKECDSELYEVLSSDAKNIFEEQIGWFDGMHSNQYQQKNMESGNEMELRSGDQDLTQPGKICRELVAHKMKTTETAVAQFKTFKYTALTTDNGVEMNIDVPLLEFDAKLSTIGKNTFLLIRGSGAPYAVDTYLNSRFENTSPAYFCSSSIHRNAKSFYISRPHFNCTYTKCDDVKTKMNPNILMIPFSSTYNMCQDAVNYDFTKFCNQYSESDVGDTMKIYSNRKKSTLVGLKTVKVVCNESVDSYVLISTYIKM